MPLPSEETTPPVTKMYLAIAAFPYAIVGRTPWSARVPLDPLFVSKQFPAERERPARGPAADQGVRPTGSACATRLEQFHKSLQIFRGVHSDGFVFGLYHANGMPVFERAQLLQTLGLFQRADG